MDLPKVFTAKLTTGEEYTGNQQYRGTGITRWCALCGSPKLTGDGSVQRVLGLRQWVCKLHPKKVVSNA